MLSSLTIATHETPTARYFHRDEARTLQVDGEDTLGQTIKMNLTRSGQFYASQESLAMNSDSLRLEHGAYPLFGKKVFSPSRSRLL